MTHRILVGSYSRSVSTLVFDPAASALSVLASVEVGHHPSWLARHPADPALAYTGLEQADGCMLALRVDAAGRAAVVARAGAGGADPASFAALAGELIVGNYSSGNVAILPTAAAPPSIAPEPSAVHVLPFAVPGPNAARQEASHPHQVVHDAARDVLLVPDLGADRTWIFSHEPDTKAWARTGVLEYAPGAGPRHLLVHGDFVYTLCELDSTVTTHRYGGSALPISRASTMFDPPNPLGDMLAAEIAFYPPPPPPSSSRSVELYTPRFLYVSNRNHPGPSGDLLAIFSLEDATAPALSVEIPTGLKHVRGLAVAPDGRWVIVGGAQGGGVKVLEVTGGGKGLREVAMCALEAPTSFLWL
ncbi:Lactonase, 7-bladed beta-propeller-domain-containing protein [Vararia minispora EC-137]|uniref:Lactonase, 7-bladed beta-propeller-domain-containing protein n=1 Tax=Vararia minispora EC-137 TaxID=1314806 RepID=A0ACB8QGY7_9AGAM|nr:Lactonase, 7-bladed beta-propeller-domain-containing protein [Vararia minispora EC-137]